MVLGIFKISLRLRDRPVFKGQSVKILNVCNTLTLKQIFWVTKIFFKKLEHSFLVEGTKIENALLPYKTTISEASVKTNHGTIIRVHIIVPWYWCRYARQFIGKIPIGKTMEKLLVKSNVYLEYIYYFQGKCSNLRYSLIYLWQPQKYDRGFPSIFTNSLCSNTVQYTVKIFTSSVKWRVTVSGELMFLESYGNCDVTNTVTLLL